MIPRRRLDAGTRPFLRVVPGAAFAAALLVASGCSTSSKLAETQPYDVSEGDYLTPKEYEELSKDEALAYCQELEREIDIQTDDAKLTEESLVQAQTDLVALQSSIDGARRRLGEAEAAPADATVPPPSSDLPTTYRVVPGDWLSKIALKPEIYGNWREWPRIHKANDDQIRDPDLIYPGQVFTIPRGEGGGAGGENSEDEGRAEAPEMSRSGSEAASPDLASSGGGGRSWVVQPGETLRILAEREYGSREEWERIWDANRGAIEDPDRVLAGTSLILP